MTTAIVKAATQNMISASGSSPRPAASSRIASPTAIPAGISNSRRSIAGVTRRHAITGPIPDSRVRIRAKRDHIAAERWWSTDAWLAGHRLGDQGEEGSPEDDEGERDKDEVVEQEDGLAREQ